MDPIKPMIRPHARAAARLHNIGLPRAFLTGLGETFLYHLYTALPECPSAFGYVWEEADGSVLGFIACAENTGRVYRQALRRRGVRMALAILLRVIRWSVLKSLVETLCYPSQVQHDRQEGLPPAEILSIAVEESTRGKGVGKRLIQTAFEEFRRRGIHQVRVVLGARNLTANAFYKRCGFELKTTRTQHGKPTNIYVAEIGAPATTPINKPAP